MISKFLKILFTNLLIFILLLLSIETASYFGRKILKKDDVGWLIKKLGAKVEALRDDCLRFRTHPYFSHAHDHKDNCNKILNGRADGPFVVYGNNNVNANDAILLLGGSTTDGFFYKFAGGKTWPYFLNKTLLDNNINNFKIYNGGVGGYSSSQELLKLIIDGQRISENIKYVISFNGINDMPGYSGTREYEKLLPYWTEITLSMFSDGDWIVQSSSPVPNYFPSTFSLINFIKNKIIKNDKKFEVKSLQDLEKKPRELEFLSKSKKNDWEKAILIEKNKIISADELWLSNIKLMHKVSKNFGAEYIVFIQPSLGINNYQVPEEGTKDYELYKKMDKINYLPNMIQFMEKIRNKCKKLNYCYDMTEKVVPIGSVYYDSRHHNEKGNEQIANLIFRRIFEQIND
tara:strand:- start:2456 stop:3664 length:1209 start_codon:yes stop_codon:yes gene_type:complete